MKTEQQRIAIAEAPNVGVRFGRLLIVDIAPTLSARNKRWSCLCDCGTEKCVGQGELTSGKTRSCGCLRRELTAANKTKHGNAKRGAHSKEYRIWRGMLSRCSNPTTPQIVSNFKQRGYETPFYMISGFSGSASQLKRLVEIAGMDEDVLIQLIETALHNGNGRIGSDIAQALGLGSQSRKGK